MFLFERIKGGLSFCLMLSFLRHKGNEPKVRIFVFEDNDTLRSVISILLEKRGYEVMSFPEPGLCPLRLDRGCQCPQGQACADIIITDLNMPNMTGLELIENRLQNGCRVRNRAVMSAGWKDTERDQAKRLGCQIFEKPFKFDELNSWLDECGEGIAPNRQLSDLPIGIDEPGGICATESSSLNARR